MAKVIGAEINGKLDDPILLVGPEQVGQMNVGSSHLQGFGMGLLPS